ncbi:hypothetical protein [Campylobacter showae]|nr:hypothetical protein [Campylobacter showae]
MFGLSLPLKFGELSVVKFSVKFGFERRYDFAEFDDECLESNLDYKF